MAIISPCVDTIITQNQVTPHVTNVAISNTNMFIPASATFPVQLQAPGMVNVEVWTHGVMAKRLTSDGVGGFSGTVDTTKAALCAPPLAGLCNYEGPMLMEVIGWNTAPGDNSFTFKLQATLDVWVHNTLNSWYPFGVTPKGAGTMRQVFLDRFGTLSATACKPGTGPWGSPSCVKPSATDGFTYYENMPEGGNFGNAAFEHTDSPTRNPYNLKTTQCTGAGCEAGFLRIRSTYDPNYVDPYGFNRHWYGGLLSTMFPDHTSRLPVMNTGYCEARIKIPKADASWNTGASGGTWPALWMLDRDTTGTSGGNEEVDIVEENGAFGSWLAVNMHSYSPVTGPNQAIYHNQPLPGKQDLTWEFHRYGVSWNPTTTTAWFDDQNLGSVPSPVFPGGKLFSPFLMVDMDQGGGWPSNPPPAGYNDLWVDYIKCYAP